MPGFRKALNSVDLADMSAGLAGPEKHRTIDQ
jgi:hypothetical protein